MSQTETHKGKLVKLKLDHTDGVVTEFPKGFTYVIIDGEMYELKDTVEYDSEDSLAHCSVDVDGNIDYVCRFDNGATCFDKELGEMIEGIDPESNREEMVTISKKDYDYLNSKSFKLECLESVGVNSWGGYYHAMEKFYKNDGK